MQAEANEALMLVPVGILSAEQRTQAEDHFILISGQTADAAPRSVTMPMVQLTPEQQAEYAALDEKDQKPVYTISVYLNDGRVFDYDVGSMASAREHSAAIVATGYRSVQEDNLQVMTHYPPHRIEKVKVTGNVPVSTSYTDRVRGT